MAYEIKDLDPVKELSPARRWIEFCIVFVITFLLVRFGGWHHDMDPLGYPVYPSYWISLLVAAAVSSIFILWRNWYSSHSAAPQERRAMPRD
ncbi:MAG TPA: hypothetical protein VNU94_04660 [Acidobacteriaceae bacterium]|jgi:hypothetical protein|nr:hypothetical protein [Acidobacteriaceae bacterium]